MQMTPVTSSNIQAVGYEPGEMRIQFANGNIYKYTGPKVAAHYEAFMKAQSKGAYFAQHMRRCPETQCVRHIEGDTEPT